MLQKDPEEGDRLFRKVLELEPDAYTKSWSLLYLARLADSQPDGREEALSFYKAALAVEGAPDSVRTGRRKRFERSFRKKINLGVLDEDDEIFSWPCWRWRRWRWRKSRNRNRNWRRCRPSRPNRILPPRSQKIDDFVKKFADTEFKAAALYPGRADCREHARRHQSDHLFGSRSWRPTQGLSTHVDGIRRAGAQHS